MSWTRNGTKTTLHGMHHDSSPARRAGGAGANRSLAVILAAIGLDAVGVGLVFPILPRLLEDVTHTREVAPYIGVMTALYAIMQFAFAPVLGALSDNVGRRPVLLVSIAGAAFNYVALAFAPALWMLLVARAVAGLTSANLSVAMAYVTDVTPEAHRPRRFGTLNAMFGIGFIVGPVLGGVLGDYGVRLPFIAAAALNAVNFALAWLVLPESRVPSRKRIDLAALDPLRPLRWLFARRDLVPIAVVFFVMSAAGEAYGSCWALWSSDTFHWNGRWIGLSLGTFGVCHVIVQALLPGIATRRLGERGAVLGGIACACAALVVLAFAREGFLVFAVMPVFALEGIGTPALQARATRQVEPALQGQLQGVLASAMSLASIAAPLFFTTVYFMVRRDWPGAVWLSTIATLAIAVPLTLRATRAAPRPT